MTAKLDAFEERELLKAARAGDMTARDKLWVAFDEFSRSRAKFHARNKGLDESEAESLASEAFLWTLERFDLRRKTRFSTYLDYHLRGWMEFGAREERRQREIIPSKSPQSKRAAAKLTSRQKCDFLLGLWLAAEHPDMLSRLMEGVNRHDRIIARNLWNRAPPRSQSWLAKSLGITRSAVCQRRQMMLDLIYMRTGKYLPDHILTASSLNNLGR